MKLLFQDKAKPYTVKMTEKLQDLIIFIQLPVLFTWSSESQLKTSQIQAAPRQQLSVPPRQTAKSTAKLEVEEATPQNRDTHFV